jgi:hypothetical protein
MKTLIVCPNHEGNFDCTPFCSLCEGDQEFYSDGVVAEENTKGEIFAYDYKGVTIRPEGNQLTVWKSALGYSLFSPDNKKYFFDSLNEVKWFIEYELTK